MKGYLSVREMAGFPAWSGSAGRGQSRRTRRSLPIRGRQRSKSNDILRGTRSKRATGILKRMGYMRVKSIGGISGYKGMIERW